MASNAPPVTGAAYWIRTLRPWKGECVEIRLASAGVEVGRLVAVNKDGPILEAGETRRRACTWQDIQSVETVTEIGGRSHGG